MTIKTTIKNAIDKIAKKEATIARKIQWIEAATKSAFETECLIADVRRLRKEVAATQKTIEKYEKQLAGETARDNIFAEVPETMKTLQTELVTRWNEFDLQRRNALKERYHADSREFWKLCTRADYEFIYRTDEQIAATNERSARILIIDLFNRIRRITGEVADWRDIHYSGGALNGYVTGKEGRATIKTIIAGGHNIQRLHIRVLVHEA